ncbi:oxysterol-binding protein-related protein 1-like isoform X5 [Esox lucius]|uniref:oxysterol-binding protein-related protein 1-like isoform X5 n=1 Tax=Esox lucius TaxID=8010 RepID=UPI00097343FC|nr:oxysterol-binding protein-related protein 1-like isoform X5 [Esox lucius]
MEAEPWILPEQDELSMTLHNSAVTMNSEEEFYDAETGLESGDDLSDVSFKDALVNDCKDSSNAIRPQDNGVWERRKTLPAPMISRSDYSVWGILKKCVGMDLSKITMPIVFNEPLSFLQRMSEYMQHTHLIHKACTLSDSIDRMQLFSCVISLCQVVAAFAVSSVASQLDRTGKPFNPLLGETYELTRHKEAYTWTNPFCCVHNIIMGKLWIEQYGTVEIENHHTGDRCVLNFKPCGLFGKELHKVEGHIQDKSKKKRRVLYGKWTECMYSVDPKMYEASKNKGDAKIKTQQQCAGEETEGGPEVQETVAVIPGSALLWRIAPRPPDSEQMYNFTRFTMTLNELEPGMERLLAPTDCRLRPDIRAMENGDLDTAHVEKDRLEEKQRVGRKERSNAEEEWLTRWFQLGSNHHTGAQDWLYKGKYFDRNYTNCPNIY